MAIESKIQTTIGLCIIEVTKFLMNRYHIDRETAYKKLLATEFYSLLDDSETRLYLEPNGYLCKACALELDEGKNALYAFINQ